MHRQTNSERCWSGIFDDRTTSIGGWNGVFSQRNDDFDYRTSDVGYGTVSSMTGLLASVVFTFKKKDVNTLLNVRK